MLVLGHVTCDEIAGRTRLGGAASFAARAAARLELDVALVTVARPDDPLLATLRTPRLRFACAPDDAITTFALDYTGPTRTVTLRRRARSLRVADIPTDWLRAPVAYVGPVAAECDRALIAALGARFVGAGLQG